MPLNFFSSSLVSISNRLQTGEALKKEAGSFVHPNPFGASFSYNLTTVRSDGEQNDEK